MNLGSSEEIKRGKALLFGKKSVPLSLLSDEKKPQTAPVAELVDAPDLGSGVARRAGSSPVRRTYSLHLIDCLSVFYSPFLL